ncbi:Serine/threonine-protein phosphatase 5 [Morus notabilis]|uniref:Serine/threonine-protein phosphatase 5 n=1 Tax=Morus notabilis TaxID=981085 RepID=W9QE55_9ROSA|nr:Serine/threonine-protein phosphatase 5 [Morus notabilis]
MLTPIKRPKDSIINQEARFCILHKPAVKRLCPNDPDDTARKLEECEKAVKKLKFEEPIAVPVSQRRSIVESIDYRTIDVEPQYSGAKIGDVVTLDFVKKMTEDFKNQKSLHKRYAYQIVLQTREMLRALPSLFYDLLNIFELNGLPLEENSYLFNGDFVDRGSFSLEVILTLFAFKCMSLSAMHLARGNHESKSMNKIYGFEGEVRSKLSETFVELFAEVFCCLPLAHVINQKVFVVHGGLFSVDGVKLSDIRAIDRFCEPPEEGLLRELLWSDPQPSLGRGPSKRGVGLSFGADVTKRFLQDNNLDLVLRSHEVKDEGYEIEHDGKLITVFSAPNYCDQMGNKGAFIRFEAPNLKPNIVTFSAVIFGFLTMVSEHRFLADMLHRQGWWRPDPIPDGGEHLNRRIDWPVFHGDDANGWIIHVERSFSEFRISTMAVSELVEVQDSLAATIPSRIEDLRTCEDCQGNPWQVGSFGSVDAPPGRACGGQTDDGGTGM